MTFGAEAISKAKLLPPMMRHNIEAFKPHIEMNLTNMYHF